MTLVDVVFNIVASITTFFKKQTNLSTSRLQSGAGASTSVHVTTVGQIRVRPLVQVDAGLLGFNRKTQICFETDSWFISILSVSGQTHEPSHF